MRRITVLGDAIKIDNNPSQFTTKIPAGAWLCNINQKNYFDTDDGYLSQANACENVTN